MNIINSIYFILSNLLFFLYAMKISLSQMNYSLLYIPKSWKCISDTNFLGGYTRCSRSTSRTGDFTVTITINTSVGFSKVRRYCDIFYPPFALTTRTRNNPFILASWAFPICFHIIPFFE